MLHDTNNSKSLLKQLSKKGKILFYNTCPDYIFLQSDFFGLTGFALGPNKTNVVPRLDNTDKVGTQFLAFNDWWNKTIIVDNNNKRFSRKDIILNIANKDGGSHVDPKVKVEYDQLSKGQSLNWKQTIDGLNQNVKLIQLATARQIAHEVLVSFAKSIPKAFESIGLKDSYLKEQSPAEKYVKDGGIIFNADVRYQ